MGPRRNSAIQQQQQQQNSQDRQVQSMILTTSAPESPSQNGYNSSNSLSQATTLNNVSIKTSSQGSLKTKKATKQPKFFSRLLKKKASHDDDDELDRENAKDRDEGWKAGVFGYVPNFPTAPKYIWVRAHKKKNREFNRLFLAQKLSCGSNDTLDNSSKASVDSSENKKTIWCARFSLDGRYLATAGADQIIRVWQVISSPEEREVVNAEFGQEAEPDNCSFRSRRSSMRRGKTAKVHAPVFLPFPVKEFRGHTAAILDLSWSKNNFLLSSAMDKTVRLWHMKRSEAISTYKHPDYVTSIAFHPEDDRFFLSGSLDCKLRLWSITEKKISFEARAPDLIMAVAFTPDGNTSIAGCFGGQCLFYKTKGLTLNNQMVVKSTHGKNSNGSRIIGIEVIALPKTRNCGERLRVLISTNDSRVRLYNFADRSIIAKFKGHENSQGSIRASFSNSGIYGISGSEDERTYIWRIDREFGDTSKTREDYEYFHSNSSTVVVALFAPDASRRILYESRDPIYDIVDPPQVILKRPSVESIRRGASVEPPLPSLSNYKINHEDGNIIITADQDGNIKVFRQDSAHERRKQWLENASIQKKKIGNIALSPTPSFQATTKIMRGMSPIGNRPRNRSDVSGYFSLEAPRSPALAGYTRDPISRSGSQSSISSWGSRTNTTATTTNSNNNNSSSTNLHMYSRPPSQLTTGSNVLTPTILPTEFDPDEIVCKTCGGTDFRARASRTTGSMALICAK
jgi:WD40 repeat protein